MIKCENCEATCPNHKWGKIRAHNDGWTFMWDGRAYCPSHMPDWKKRKKAKE